MRIRVLRSRRRGSVLVEYGLLIAGVALACVLAVAVLGHKTQYAYGVMSAILPGAHADDNKPVQESKSMPLNTSGGSITLDSSQMVSPQGTDRLKDVLGPGAGEQLIVDGPQP